MVKRVLVICGVLLLLAGIGLGIYIYSATASAQALDKDRKIGFESGGVLQPAVTGS